MYLLIPNNVPTYNNMLYDFRGQRELHRAAINQCRIVHQGEMILGICLE